MSYNGINKFDEIVKTKISTKMAENDRSQWPEDNSAHAIFEINLLPVKFPKLAKMTFF